MQTTTAPGANLREIRQRAGLTQQDLAAAARTTITTIQRIEKGDEPTVRIARRICVVLGCTFDELLGSPAGEAA